MKFHFLKTNPKGPYEGVPVEKWQDWKWQLRNSLKSQSDFEKLMILTDEEKLGFQDSKTIFQIRTTPYYASLASREVADDPVRLIQVPHAREMKVEYQQMLDPLGEEANSVGERIIHRYADRVLFLVTDLCSVYCRFCTRKRFTGQHQAKLKHDEYKQAIQYIREHKEVREVILSGGDPLTLDDESLEFIIHDLRGIEHVEIIRVGSRMPVVNPFRMTDSLVSIFKKYKPVYLMTHFNHPRELTEEARVALEKVADAGVPMMNQMVLLNGVNNHHLIVQALSRRLLYLRVKPYYMFQCDPSNGTDHMRTSISNSLQIQRKLWGHMSGLAMPNFSVDIPRGGGKAGFAPSFLQKDSENRWSFRGFDGIECEYIDPNEESIKVPLGVEEYAPEWHEKKGLSDEQNKF